MIFPNFVLGFHCSADPRGKCLEARTAEEQVALYEQIVRPQERPQMLSEGFRQAVVPVVVVAMLRCYMSVLCVSHITLTGLNAGICARREQKTASGCMALDLKDSLSLLRS